MPMETVWQSQDQERNNQDARIYRITTWLSF